MKTIILSVISIFAFSAFSAQEVKFGIRGGVNSTTPTGDTDDNIRSKTGFDLGFISEILISEKFAVQPELLYSAQSYMANKNATLLHYINVPIMANFFITRSFNLEAGPQIGFLTAAKTKFDDGNADVKDFYKDAKELYEPINFSLNFGVGYNFTPNVALNLRYSLGLSNTINSSNKYFKSKDAEVKNNVFSASLVLKYL